MECKVRAIAATEKCESKSLPAFASNNQNMKIMNPDKGYACRD